MTRGSFGLPGLAAKRQIFNPREAFSMLSRELLDFMRARHVDCSVETGGDDVYHWIVDLGSFTDGSALARVSASHFLIP